MKWLMLLLAGIFEVIWAIAMKYSNGFTYFYNNRSNRIKTFCKIIKICKKKLKF